MSPSSGTGRKTQAKSLVHDLRAQLKGINRAATLAELLRSARSAVRALGAGRALLLANDGAGGFAALPPGGLRLNARHVIISRVFRSARPTFLSADHRPGRAAHNLLREIGAHSAWAVPLLAGRQRVGLLFALGASSTDGDQRAQQLTELSEQLAPALHRLLQVEAAERRAHRLGAVWRVGRSLSAQLQLDDLVDAITRDVNAAMSSRVTSLMLREDDRRLIIRGHQRLLRVGSSETHLDRCQDLAEQVLQDGRARISSSVPNALECKFPELAGEGGTHCVACVPIRTGEGVIGTLSCFFTERHQFKREDMRLLTGLADQVALGLENIQLHEQVQLRLQQVSRQRDFIAAVIEHVPAGIAVLSADDFVFLHANPVFQSFPGAGSEIVGRRLTEVIPNAEESGLLNLLQAAAETGEAFRIHNFRLFTAQGDPTHWTFSLTPERDPESGAVSRLILLVVDVSEQALLTERIERAMQAERERADQLEATISSMNDAVLITDAQGQVTRYNQAAEALLGWTGRELRASHHVLDLMVTRLPDGQELPVERHPVVRALTSGDVISSAELLTRSSEGREQLLSVSTAPLVAQDGARYGAVAVLRDVTELRQAQQRLADAYQAERRAAMEARTLYAVAQALASAPSFHDQLAIVARSLAEVAGVNRCLILMLHGDRLTPVAAFGLPESRPDYLAARDGDLPALAQLAEAALTSQKPLIIPDLAARAELDPAILERWELRSLLIFPLVFQGRLMGAAYLDQRGEQRDFQRSDIRLADSVASQAAVAIEHARLYEAGQARTRLLETLVGELNHRVRNNLATISGLLALQLVEDRPELTKSDVLRDSIARIQSIAAIQDLLQEEQVDLRQAAERIAQLTQQTFASPGQQYHIQVSGESVNLSPRAATYAGLAINELLANAIKHGLRGRPRGSVLVWVTAAQGQATVEVADDGVGLPRGFAINGNSHTGVRIVRGLVETELRGELSIAPRPGGGTVSRIRFPLATADFGSA